MINTIRNYIDSYTENFREWLAWKIFPEFEIYMEAAKRIGEIDENLRCTDALENADSACSGWAVETIGKRTSPLADIMKRLGDEFGEPPF
jgi:hypothetical protein